MYLLKSQHRIVSVIAVLSDYFNCLYSGILAIMVVIV